MYITTVFPNASKVPLASRLYDPSGEGMAKDARIPLTEVISLMIEINRAFAENSLNGKEIIPWLIL